MAVIENDSNTTELENLLHLISRSEDFLAGSDALSDTISHYALNEGEIEDEEDLLMVAGGTGDHGYGAGLRRIREMMQAEK